MVSQIFRMLLMFLLLRRLRHASSLVRWVIMLLMRGKGRV